MRVKNSGVRWNTAISFSVNILLLRAAPHLSASAQKQIEYKIACIGGNAVVRDLLDSHELLGGLPPLIFLLLFHVGSSHSKICCSVM